MHEPSSTQPDLRLVDPDDLHGPSPFDVPGCAFAADSADGGEIPGSGSEAAGDAAPARVAHWGRRSPLFQSPRADYSIRWTETGLVGSVPPEADGDWPSDRWRAHLASCGPVRACRHRVPEPEWWVLMAGRGFPFHPDAATAREMANETINRFKGHPTLPEELLRFTQEVARDSLIVAPQPVGPTWVKSTLAIVAMLVRSVASDGGPITREHVFTETARNRLLYVHMADYKQNSVRTYRGRLDLITMALQGVTVRTVGSLPPLQNSLPSDPCTVEEEATLYPWAAGLRPDERRKRMVATVVVGLAVGARTPELIRLRSDDITVNATGVHVCLTNTDGVSRVVTCRREWEDRLIELVKITPPGHYLVAPWRDTQISDNTYSLTVWNAQQASTPPRYFSARSLRSTWLVRQMEAGVPVRSLLEAADLRSGESLFRMLAFTRTQDPVAASAALRGPG